MSKGSLALITALFIATTSPALLAATPLPTEIKEGTSFTGRVTGNKVRLRTQPTLEAHVVRETFHGELLGISGEQQDFYLVQAPTNFKGYVFRTFILDNVVEGDNINIRLFPDADAPIIGKLLRGEKVDSIVCSENNKWLEITAPSSVHFFIAKEYIEKCGPIEMLAQVEKRQHEATYHLSSAFHFAQAELQKSFAEIDLESITKKFTSLTKEYSDLKEIITKANEIVTILQDNYLQKKIAFLESRAGVNDSTSITFSDTQRERLNTLGLQVTQKVAGALTNNGSIAEKTAKAIGLTEAIAASTEMDKMHVWQPLEESIYHLWIAVHGEGSMEQFYKEEEIKANVLTGIVEPYTRPVKNRPGDFILKNNNLPIAFIYSTHVDLEKMVGKQVTVKAAPRPNNSFAFPAYFVLSVE